jgi:hypothetical protein
MRNGGWLDSYEDGGTMQEYQENYNDNYVSLPEGFVGEGYNTKGRNYSPAWGGQFQMGGSVYPVNYVPEAQMGASIPGAVGFSYARTQSPAPSNGKYAKKTMASAQDGKTFPEFKKIVPKSEEERLRESLKERPRTVVRDNTAVVNRVEKGKQKTVNPNQQVSTKYNAVKEAKQKEEETKAMLADRKARIEDSILAQDEDIIGNPNWREVMARETQATGDKFRLFPEEDSFIDDWLNPAVMIGNMATDLGQAPYYAKEEDSYMPYLTAIGAPLLTGAIEGIGAKNNRQFINNLANPFNIVPGYKSVEKTLGKQLRKIPTSIAPELRYGGVIKDDMGQWNHPGEITEIGSPYITMQGVPYDVLGISDTGDTKLMKPGKNYKFKGKKVTEYPMAKNGLRQEQKGLQNLDNLLNFTNYNTKQPGGWLDKY